MVQIHPYQISYVLIGVDDLTKAAQFATEIVGLEQLDAGDDDIAYFKSDSRYQTVIVEGGSNYSAIGIELENEAAIDTAMSNLLEAGFECRKAEKDECARRFVRAAALTKDGSGNNIELVARPQHSGKRYFPSRDAGIVGLHNVGLRSTDIERDRFFWTKIFDAVETDWVGEITYLSIDAMHHRIALYPAKHAGILYVGFEVESLDSIMQGHYFAQSRQIREFQGPGKEAASGQEFLRLEGIGGICIAYVHGMKSIDPKSHRASQFALAKHSICMWGSEANNLPELEMNQF